MSYETDNPFAVVDTECDPPAVVTRYKDRRQAEWFINHLANHGGTVTRAKIDRGGYRIDGPRGDV